MIRGQRILFLAGVLLSTVFFFGLIKAVADPFGGPAIQFDYREVDFGIMAQKSHRDTVFTFRNSGDKELVILDVKTSCGCTAALASESVIPVNGTGTINVRFDSKRFKGPVTKTIRVKCNDPGEPETVLKVKAHVKPLVNVSPERINFGLIRKGKTVHQTIRLGSEKGKGLKVEDVQISEGIFEWKMRTVSVPDSDIVIIDLDLKEDPPLGTVRAQVKIQTAFKGMKPILIPIRGELVHHFRISPSSLNLGSFKIGKAHAPVIIIRPVGTQKFIVETARMANPKIKISLVDGRVKDTFEIYVEVASDIKPGRINEEIIVKTNDPAQPVLKIPVLGYARGGK